MYLHRIISILLVSALLFYGACSDAFHDDDAEAEVKSITIGDSMIPRGEKRGIVLNLRYSEDDVFDDNDDVVVALVLPTELIYTEDSANIEGVFDDEGLNPIRIFCDDGSTLLIFNIDEDDLRGAQEPSSADARLRLEVTAVSLTSGANIEARADYNSTVAICGIPITAQASLVISVVGVAGEVIEEATEETPVEAAT